MKKCPHQLTTEKFVQKAIKIHEDKYSYSQVSYKNRHTKVIIICPIHGPFQQKPSLHLSGKECPKCSIKQMGRNGRLTTKQFIDRSNKIHKRKYDYSKTIYHDSKTKIVIVCPEHGKFEQTPTHHLLGHGCIKCSTKTKGKKSRLTLKQFINKAQKIHGNKYNYGQVNYINNATKITIICPEHGPFEQKPANHLRGQKCPSCSMASKRLDQEEFIRRSQKAHKNKYNYSKTKYKNSYNMVVIVCPEHGEFKQKPSDHWRGRGCLECAKNSDITTEQFINKAKKIHGNEYNYKQTNYRNVRTKITIMCIKHGSFEQTPDGHLAGHGCPLCPTIISSGHQKIIDFIESTCDEEISINNRSVIAPYELDIYISGHNFAIEYNGAYYHSFNCVESTKERNRHKDKHLLCKNKKIDLIQINEHEYLKTPQIIESIIANKLGKSQKIFARKCKIIQINNEAHNQFMDSNHIYGQGNYPLVAYGLTYQDNLVLVISFSKHKKHEWEINRMASKLHCSIAGGASRLFKHFIKKHNPKQILTYADARFGCGNVYEHLGFVKTGMTNPGYGYLKGYNYYGRQKFQKHKLKNMLETFNPDMTEAENMFANKYRRLWDAGHYKYLYG